MDVYAMANRTRIVFNESAMRELRTSPEMLADITDRVKRIEAAADSSGPGGLGYASAADVESERVSGAVFTKSAQAIRDNAENNTLIRSLDAGRG